MRLQDSVIGIDEDTVHICRAYHWLICWKLTFNIVSNSYAALTATL